MAVGYPREVRPGEIAQRYGAAVRAGATPQSRYALFDAFSDIARKTASQPARRNDFDTSKRSRNISAFGKSSQHARHGLAAGIDQLCEFFMGEGNRDAFVPVFSVRVRSAQRKQRISQALFDGLRLQFADPKMKIAQAVDEELD
jgi:hypothetical protein